MELYDKGETKAEIVGGNIVLVNETSGAKIEVIVKVDYFLDLLKAKIPGTIDDTLIDLVKAALKAV